MATPVYNRTMSEKKTTEKQMLFSSIKRREWDSLDKTDMFDIRNGDSDVLL